MLRVDPIVILFLVFGAWIAGIEYLSRRLDPVFLKSPGPSAPLYEKGGNWSSLGLFLTFLSAGLPLEWLFFPPLVTAGGVAIWGALCRIIFLAIIWVFVKDKKRQERWFATWNKLAVVFVALSVVLVLLRFNS
jgi:hypothetical protein